MTFERYSENKNQDHFIPVRRFLKTVSSDPLFENWYWARWGWMIGHPNLEAEMLDQIGLWKEKDRLIGIVTHDMRKGEAYCITLTDDDLILSDMVKFAEKNIAFNHTLSMIVHNRNTALIHCLKFLGYRETERREFTLVYDLKKAHPDYVLPEGFTVTSFHKDRNIQQYLRVLFKGFENQGEPPPADLIDQPLRSNWNEDLSVFIKAPGGEYAAHCGIWYEEGEPTAYIEPVCTLPEYRKKGLAKAAVYEAMQRCEKLGAKRAIVISGQAFYYKIGFELSSSYAFWEKRL